MSTHRICVLPFNQISIGANGSLRICCNAFEPELRVKGERIFPHQYTDLAHFKDNDALSEIRSGMLRGETPKICERCWQMEQNQKSSFREFNNSCFPEALERLQNGNAEFKLEYLNLDFGNKCNLACKMCTPFSSKFLAKEQSQGSGHLSIKEVSIAETALRLSEQKPWYEHENFWQALVPHLNHLQRAYIIGGEPFIIDEHEILLRLIVEHGNPERVTLVYSSNLTIVPDSLFELWQKFQRVLVNASIDGVDDAYEYIRWPAKYERVTANLAKIRKYNLANLDTAIHCTVQNLSVSSLGEMVRRYPDRDIFFIEVSRPEYLQPSVLPKAVIARALDEIQTILSCGTIIHENTRSNLPGLVESLTRALAAPPPSDQLRSQFLRAMAWYDERRKQNLFDTHPYFAEWTEQE